MTSEATINQTWSNTIVQLFRDIAGGIRVEQRTGGTLKMLAPVHTSVTDAITAHQDPWDNTVFGRFNDDPSWADFPRWLSEQYSTTDPSNPQD